MLELKVRKIGNSLGVVLPKEAVRRLHADEGDRLFLIEAPNGVYQLYYDFNENITKLVQPEVVHSCRGQLEVTCFKMLRDSNSGNIKPIENPLLTQ